MKSIATMLGLLRFAQYSELNIKAQNGRSFWGKMSCEIFSTAATIALRFLSDNDNL